jgi:hypothetical protein
MNEQQSALDRATKLSKEARYHQQQLLKKPSNPDL